MDKSQHEKEKHMANSSKNDRPKDVIVQGICQQSTFEPDNTFHHQSLRLLLGDDKSRHLVWV